MAADNVDEPAALEALALPGEDVAVDARLEALLDAGEGVEVEGEELLAVTVPQELGEEVSEQAQSVTGVWMWERARRRAKGAGAGSPASKGIRRQFACLRVLCWAAAAVLSWM